jgi:peptidoglycan hydrolase-like protein with peptidoglycan-binding domain
MANEGENPGQDFEREKWHEDVRLREREIDIRASEQQRSQAELTLKQREFDRSRWSSPLVLAVLGATTAGLFNAVVAWWSSKEQRSLEDNRAATTQALEKQKDTSTAALEANKAESARILEMIKTGDPDKAASNLKFLVDAGLITDPGERIKTYLANRKPGEGAALPLPGGALSFSAQSGTVSGTGIYKLGDTASEVGLVQSLLAQEGFAVVADGQFGPATDVSVRAYQAKNRLPVNGLIGPRLIELAGKKGERLLPENYRDLDPDSLLVRCMYLTMALEGTTFDSLMGNIDGFGLTVGVGFTVRNGEVAKLLLNVNQDSPDMVRQIAGDKTDTLLANLQKSTADVMLWADSISAANKTTVQEPWHTILTRILQSDASKRAQIQWIKSRYYPRAAALHKEMNFSSERALCMLFDFMWQRGAPHAATIAEYKRLDSQLAGLEQAGPDAIEQARIRNFFNAVAASQQARPEFRDFVQKRQLLFVFGKGNVHARDFNLAANFAIELIPLTR